MVIVLGATAVPLESASLIVNMHCTATPGVVTKLGVPEITREPDAIVNAPGIRPAQLPALRPVVLASAKGGVPVLTPEIVTVDPAVGPYGRGSAGAPSLSVTPSGSVVVANAGCG